VTGAATDARRQTQGGQQCDQGRETWPPRKGREGKHGRLAVRSQRRLESDRTLAVVTDNLGGFPQSGNLFLDFFENIATPKR
jgi:hypothetical protein